jgi:hypothetical protein
MEETRVVGVSCGDLNDFQYLDSGDVFDFFDTGFSFGLTGKVFARLDRSSAIEE